MSSKQSQNLVNTTIASTLAGSIAKLIVHPIDTIKAKVQVNRSRIDKLQDFTSGVVTDTIKKTYRSQGIPGFFRGVDISVLGSTIAFSAFMTAYQFSKNWIKKYDYFRDHPFQSYFLSGFFAEFVSCIFWLPIDVIKERMQVQSQLKMYHYRSSLEAMKMIQQNQGIRGLYRAFGATLMFFGPYSAILFVFYQKFKNQICKNPAKPTLNQNILASILSSCLAGFLTNPLDLAKLRMQIQRADKASRGGNVQFVDTLFGYKNMFHGIYTIARKEGFLSLFRGSLLRVCFTAPNTTISLVLTEFFKQKIINFRRKTH